MSTGAVRASFSMAEPATGRILVALENVDGQDGVLQFACAEAVRRGHQLLLVHMVADRPGTVSSPTHLPPSAIWKQAEGVVRDAAERAKYLAGEGLRVETRILEGPVVRGLVELSRDVELIVVQQRVVTRMRRMVTGSVTAELAGETSAPTVSVPGGWQVPAGGTSRIAVGIDAAGEDSAVLLRQAFGRASVVGARLTIVHAWQLSTPHDDAIVEPSAIDAWRRRYLGALEATLSPLRSAYPEVPVTVEVHHMRAVDALVRASGASDLLLVGRGRLAHPLISHLGSVTRALISDARCPVEITADRAAVPSTAAAPD